MHILNDWKQFNFHITPNNVRSEIYTEQEKKKTKK